MWSWPISKYWPSNHVEWIAKIQKILLTEASIPVMVWNLLSFNICPLKSTDHYITHVLDSGTDCYWCMYQVLTATCEGSEIIFTLINKNVLLRLYISSTYLLIFDSALYISHSAKCFQSNASIPIRTPPIPPYKITLLFLSYEVAEAKQIFVKLYLCLCDQKQGNKGE
jgi:hypothetical protein